jgi:hypothetical protein
VNRKESEKVADASQKALIQELMKKNSEATKRYEQLRSTIISAALNSFALNSSDNFKPPRHSLTGDTTIDATDDSLATSTSKHPSYISEGPHCACGLSYDEDDTTEHLNLSEMKTREAQIIRMMKMIQQNSQSTKGENVGLGLSALQTCEQIDQITAGILTCLEEIIVLQTEAFAQQDRVVVPQEYHTQKPPANRQNLGLFDKYDGDESELYLRTVGSKLSPTKLLANDMYIEQGNIELETAVQHARKRRKWNVLSIFSRIIPRGSKASTESSSQPSYHPGAVPQSVSVIVPSQPITPATNPNTIQEFAWIPQSIEDELIEEPLSSSKSYNLPEIEVESPLQSKVDGKTETRELYDVDDLVSQWTTFKPNL